MSRVVKSAGKELWQTFDVVLGEGFEIKSLQWKVKQSGIVIVC